jgi:hypothetical protein
MPRRRVTTHRPKPRRRQRTAIRHEDEEDRDLGGIEIGTIGDKAQAEAPHRAREADRRA